MSCRTQDNLSRLILCRAMAACSWKPTIHEEGNFQNEQPSIDAKGALFSPSGFAVGFSILSKNCSATRWFASATVLSLRLFPHLSPHLSPRSSPHLLSNLSPHLYLQLLPHCFPACPFCAFVGEVHAPAKLSPCNLSPLARNQYKLQHGLVKPAYQEDLNPTSTPNDVLLNLEIITKTPHLLLHYTLKDKCLEDGKRKNQEQGHAIHIPAVAQHFSSSTLEDTPIRLCVSSRCEFPWRQVWVHRNALSGLFRYIGTNGVISREQVRWSLEALNTSVQGDLLQARTFCGVPHF